jgi:hypothetical protein
MNVNEWGECALCGDRHLSMLTCHEATLGEYGPFRTVERLRIYKSTWDLKSVLGMLERKGIPPNHVVKAMSRLWKWARVPAERLGGALVIIFVLDRQ